MTSILGGSLTLTEPVSLSATPTLPAFPATDDKEEEEEGEEEKEEEDDKEEEEEGCQSTISLQS